MEARSLTSDIFYKLLVLASMLLMAINIYFTWQKLAIYPANLHENYQTMTLLELDLNSLNQEFNALQNTISSAPQQDESSSLHYTDAQLLKLINDAEQLHTIIAEKVAELQTTRVDQQNLLSATLFIIVLFIIISTISLTCMIIGGLGWYFHIKIFAERRQADRSSKKNKEVDNTISQGNP